MSLDVQSEIIIIFPCCNIRNYVTIAKSVLKLEMDDKKFSFGAHTEALKA